MLVEGRKLKPLLQIPGPFVIGNTLDEMLQQRDLTAAESSPLSGEPAVEDGAAVDLQPLQQVSVEQRGERSLPLGSERVDARIDRAGNLDRIDEAIRQI